MWVPCMRCDPLFAAMLLLLRLLKMIFGILRDNLRQQADACISNVHHGLACAANS